MSKTTICLEMLQILSARGVVSAKELARVLDTNVRNIFEYKRELEDAGYSIITVKGKYGGYMLDKTPLIPSLKLTDDEKNALIEANDFINKRYDFLSKDNYNKAMGKVFSSTSHGKQNESITIIDRFPLLMKQEELSNRYDVINECIEKNIKLKIEYSSLKNTTKNHIIHPYKVYIYNNAWFVIGWNETINDIGYFKLNRIVSFEKLRETFSILKTFNFSDYVDAYGMKNNGEFYTIKIKVMNESARVISERIYGKNQVIEYENDNVAILTCEMQNKNIIVSFVLGFGDDAVVLEPSWLKEELLNKIQNLDKIYHKMK